MSNSYRPSHFGICVTDLQRSLRFYCDGLGFEPAETYTIGNEFAAGLEVDGNVDLDAVFIRNDAMAIELLAYRSPAPVGRPSASRGQLGLTHFGFYVDDVDEAAARLVACGGTLLPDTRCKTDAVEMIFVEDPDGVRVELMRSFL